MLVFAPLHKDSEQVGGIKRGSIGQSEHVPQVATAVVSCSSVKGLQRLGRWAVSPRRDGAPLGSPLVDGGSKDTER